MQAKRANAEAGEKGTDDSAGKTTDILGEEEDADIIF